MQNKKKLRLAALLSGSGTTLQNFIDLSETGSLPADVAVVISSRPGVFGLERAAKHDIPAHVVDRKDYADTPSFSAAINDILDEAEVDLVCLCGFLSLWLPGERYRMKVLNVHPALIPAFCGKGFYGHHVHEAVLEYGVRITGATVHFADDEYDSGPIILQKAVPVEDDDTADTLAERVQAAEREIYPQAVALFAEGRLQLEGRRVRILPKAQEG